MKKIILTLIFSIFTINSLFAQSLEATFKDWSVFTVIQGSKKICYIASIPIKQEGNYNKRGEPYILVTNINNNADEISVSSGYNYKKASEVDLQFGINKIKFFTHENIAWAKSKEEDLSVIRAMKVGADVIVKGTSTLNTNSIDTYSLIGFTAAYNKMKEICK